MELIFIITLIWVLIAYVCKTVGKDLFSAEAPEVSAENFKGNNRKVVTLAQTKPALSEQELADARDRICRKNHISPFDWAEYEAVQVQTSSGWITTVQKK